MYSSNPEQIRFKRVAMFIIDAGKQMKISLASNNTFTITQYVVGQTGNGEPLSVPVPGSLRIPRSPNGIIKLLRALAWIAVRLEIEEIDVADRSFIELLRAHGEEQEIRLEQEMIKINQPPTNFNGQTYTDFQQAEDNPRRTIY